MIIKDAATGVTEKVLALPLARKPFTPSSMEFVA